MRRLAVGLLLALAYAVAPGCEDDSRYGVGEATPSQPITGMGGTMGAAGTTGAAGTNSPADGGDQD